MCDINKFVWCFCINYILLTRIIAYLISCCDLAISDEFGLAMFFWLWDAPMGYHQLAIALASQEKFAFQGPNAIKWAYTVMPFGPTDGPATFINFVQTSTANGKHLPSNQVLSLMTIRTQKSLLTTFSAGQICSKMHCRTWNVSFASARPTDSH